MGAAGRVEKPEPMKPHFAKLEMPTGKSSKHSRGELAVAIESLTIGGEAYVVPINGSDLKETRSRLSAAANAAGKRLKRKFTVRETKLGVEPVFGIWRVE